MAAAAGPAGCCCWAVCSDLGWKRASVKQVTIWVANLARLSSSVFSCEEMATTVTERWHYARVLYSSFCMLCFSALAAPGPVEPAGVQQACLIQQVLCFGGNICSVALGCCLAPWM
jgi:hypothetical protein